MGRKLRRALRAAWCPLRDPERMLPYRHWRYMWVAVAIRMLAFVILAVVIGPYWAIYGIGRAAMWIGAVMDEGSRRVAIFYEACLIADRWRSGWEPPPPERTRIQLNPKWRERIP